MTHASDPVTAPGRAARPAGRPRLSFRVPGRRARPGPTPRWAAVRVSALAAGGSAAGLALAGIAAAVLLLWIGSPFPDDGLIGALHVAAGLWLLAQGTELVRVSALSGAPEPVALAPLLLTALPAWLLFRGTASAVVSALGPPEPEEEREDGGPGDHRGATGRRAARTGSRRRTLHRAPGQPSHPVDPRAAAGVAGWVLAGYLTLAAFAVVYTARGPLRVAPASVWHLVLFAVCAAGCGAWAGCGGPGVEVLPELLRGRRRARARLLLRGRRTGPDPVAGALRCAGTGLGLLVCGGALIGAASLAWHAPGVGRGFTGLGTAPSGQLAVLLLAAALVPNLAVWAASYALGTGFAVGAGSLVAPSGVTGYGLLPSFPLLAALPGQGPHWLGWTTLAVPALATLGVAWCAGNGGWSLRGTAGVVLGAALAEGVAVAVLAAWSGGALGDQRLAEFGPLWWRAGVAACVWSLAALPFALLVRFGVAHPPRLGRSPLSRLRPRRRVRRAEHGPEAEARRGSAAVTAVTATTGQGPESAKAAGAKSAKAAKDAAGTEDAEEVADAKAAKDAAGTEDAEEVADAKAAKDAADVDGRPEGGRRPRVPRPGLPRRRPGRVGEPDAGEAASSGAPAGPGRAQEGAPPEGPRPEGAPSAESAPPGPRSAASAAAGSPAAPSESEPEPEPEPGSESELELVPESEPVPVPVPESESEPVPERVLELELELEWAPAESTPREREEAPLPVSRAGSATPDPSPWPAPAPLPLFPPPLPDLPPSQPPSPVLPPEPPAPPLPVSDP